MTDGPLVSLKRAAALSDVAPSTIRALIRSGQLKVREVWLPGSTRPIRKVVTASLEKLWGIQLQQSREREAEDYRMVREAIRGRK